MKQTEVSNPSPESVHFRWRRSLRAIPAGRVRALALALAMVFWWMWVSAFIFGWWQGWLKDSPPAYRIRRDHLGISFVLFTVLTGFVLTWAWHSAMGFRKKLCIASIAIILGLAAPMMAAAAHLLAEAHWPPGWQGDLVRAGLIICTPVLCLLTVMRVMWKNPDCDALRLRGFAFLGGWLFLPVHLMLVENRNLQQAFVHITHLYFATVLMTLISLVIVLASDWKSRHAVWTAILFTVAGLTAALPVWRQHGYAGNYGLDEPSGKGPQREEIVVTPGIRNEESSILVANSDISYDDRRELVFQVPTATLPPSQTVLTEGTRIFSITQGDEGLSNNLPGWTVATLERQPPGNKETPVTWILRLYFHGLAGQRVHGDIRLEGSHSGLIGRPVSDLQQTLPGAATIPGLEFSWQLNPLDDYGEKFRQSSVWFSWTGWCPYGAWLRDSFHPLTEPFPLLRSRQFLPVFSPTPPVPFEWRGWPGGGVHQIKFGVFGGIHRKIRWHIFPWAEYKALSAQERHIKREERLALLEGWRKSAIIIPHEVTAAFNIPISLFLHIP